MFRALTAGSSLAEAVRRPTQFGELVEPAAATRSRSARSSTRSARPGVNFLVPRGRSDRPACRRHLIDISHESLIRQWEEFSAWLQQEAPRPTLAAARSTAIGTGEAAPRTRARQPDRLARPKPSPNAAWAKRYGGDYEPVIAFLGRSQQAEQKQRNMRVVWRVAAAVSVVCTAALLTYFVQNAQKERVQRELAQTQIELNTANYKLMETQAQEAQARAEQVNQQYHQFVDDLIFGITQATKDADLNTAVRVATISLESGARPGRGKPIRQQRSAPLVRHAQYFRRCEVARQRQPRPPARPSTESLDIARKLVAADATKDLWQDDLALALVRVARVKVNTVPARTADNSDEIASQLAEARKLLSGGHRYRSQAGRGKRQRASTI